MYTVALDSLGCKLNQAETESFAWQFLDGGYHVTDSVADADVYVLNTCTVTHVADRKARHQLRLARRANPDAFIVAVGCYAQQAAQELRRLGIADLVVGNDEKDRLLPVLSHRIGTGNGAAAETSGAYRSRTRSLVKVQEGCGNFCSFCIVPYTRGKERSRAIEDVIRDVDHRVAAGHWEVVLTGTSIGSYSFNGGSQGGLPRLIQRVLESTVVERLRLSSVQPADLTPELLRLWANSRLCPHLHMPLQSGSQAVLERMNRRYSAVEFERAVSLARDAIPDLAVTTDLIVGFPGEDEREFEESRRFCQRIGFAGIHVFPYSPRPGTAAATMPAQVEDRVKKQRARQMLAVSRQSARRFRKRFLGRTMPVLLENRVGQAGWSGLTANYIRVSTESEHDLGNQSLEVRLVAECPQGLVGELAYGGGNG